MAPDPSECYVNPGAFVEEFGVTMAIAMAKGLSTEAMENTVLLSADVRQIYSVTNHKFFINKSDLLYLFGMSSDKSDKLNLLTLF